MIIDTHTHFYDPSRPQGVPWPDPNDRLLYRTVLPQHLRALVTPLGVSGAIVVEASEWLEDNQWILDLADREPFIVGVVGHLQPGDPEFVGHLERFAAHPVFRGIRPRGTSLLDLCQGKALDDLERLVEKDLTLELVFGPQELPDASRLAERLPVLRLVIDHLGGGRIQDGRPDPQWVAAIQELAIHPNVYCKVSALVEHSGQKPAPADPSYYLPTLDILWQAFGEDRLIYGSNWPVCEHFADYPTVFRIVDAYFTAKGPQAWGKYFWRNAKAVYKWKDER